jgi:hypothetical protein
VSVSIDYFVVFAVPEEYRKDFLMSFPEGSVWADGDGEPWAVNNGARITLGPWCNGASDLASTIAEWVLSRYGDKLLPRYDDGVILAVTDDSGEDGYIESWTYSAVRR